MNRRFLFGLAVLMAPAGDDGAGAAGGPPQPVAGAGGPPAAEPPATPPAAPAKPTPAAAALAAVQAARAEAKAKREAAAKPPAAPGAPVEQAVDPDALKWRSHVKAESARIAAEAEGLDPEDKALIDGEPDIARKAALLARFKREAAPAAAAKPAKVVAPAKPAGGPPSASSVDFEAAWAGGQQAWDAAKARDPAGAAKWLEGRNAPSTSSNPFSRMFNRKPAKG